MTSRRWNGERLRNSSRFERSRAWSRQIRHRLANWPIVRVSHWVLRRGILGCSTAVVQLTALSGWKAAEMGVLFKPVGNRSALENVFQPVGNLKPCLFWARLDLDRSKGHGGYGLAKLGTVLCAVQPSRAAIALLFPPLDEIRAGFPSNPPEIATYCDIMCYGSVTYLLRHNLWGPPC